LRPSFSSSSLPPPTTRFPRLTCVSEGKPFRRLLLTSKALGVEVLVIDYHGTPPENYDYGRRASKAGPVEVASGIAGARSGPLRPFTNHRFQSSEFTHRLVERIATQSLARPQMIDYEARRRLAIGVRQLAIGRITNDEFEGLYAHDAARSCDPAVRAVFWQGAWLLYSDFQQIRYTGRNRLPKDTRRHIARWILFLRSQLPYEWPLERWWQRLAWVPVHVVTLGLSARLRNKRWQASGEFAVWPFRRWTDYRAALRRLPYLANSSRGLP
jgi:hypothetical protein